MSAGSEHAMVGPSFEISVSPQAKHRVTRDLDLPVPQLRRCGSLLQLMAHLVLETLSAS